MKYSIYNDEIKKEIYNKYENICGIDEVGRGPLAGPVLACAIIMPKQSKIEGVKDSKKISKKNLSILAEKIKKEALAYSYGLENAKRIDEINIKNATKSAMLKALNGLKIKPDICLIDAERINTDIKQLNIVKGDMIEYQISCASILAKVKRDKIMMKFDSYYPGYDFFNNKGYGTKKHYMGIDKLGISPIHRKSFLKKYFERQLSLL
ncbi:MAG: ribonuclease HII [Tissierellia bacterium]|nr:ribonuclease HII [Tissierellia bacterium]